FFKLTVDDSGRLAARAAPGAPLGSRLSLLGPSGELLIQSDGVSSTNPEDRITQHLLPGTYFLRVEGLGGATGAYTLTTAFEPASPPFDPIPTTGGTLTMAAGDLNEDGFPDLVVQNDFDSRNVSVLLGVGDGTFQPEIVLPVGGPSFRIRLADFNGDGHLDVALLQVNDGRVAVLLGGGDGTFQAPAFYAVESFLFGLRAADIDGDGTIDLIAASKETGHIFLLRGRGDGTFQDPVKVAETGLLEDIVVDDFNSDGHADIVSITESRVVKATLGDRLRRMKYDKTHW